jgi:hypothetical protein
LSGYKFYRNISDAVIKVYLVLCVSGCFLDGQLKPKAETFNKRGFPAASNANESIQMRRKMRRSAIQQSAGETDGLDK